EAAGRLAVRSKPLDCKGRIQSGMLSIQCAEISSRRGVLKQQLASWLLSSTDSGGGLFGDVVTSDEDLLLVKSTAASLLVPFKAIRSWLEDYVLPTNVGLSARSPNASERSTGSVAVILLGRNEPVDLDTLLHELKDQP